MERQKQKQRQTIIKVRLALINYRVKDDLELLTNYFPSAEIIVVDHDSLLHVMLCKLRSL